MCRTRNTEIVSVPSAVNNRGLTLLIKAIDHYFGESRWRRKGMAEIRRFERMPSLLIAVKMAAGSRLESGKSYPHQQKIFNSKPSAIPSGVKRLTNAVLVKEIEAAADFEKIHDLVKRETATVKGLGELYKYDVALRVGAYLRLLPGCVHLHRGTLEGAKILVREMLLKEEDLEKGYLEISELPVLLRDFQPWEVEDILCMVDHLFRKANAKRAV